MKRHPALIPFSHFHRKVLVNALMARRNSPPIKGMPEELLGKAAYLQDFYFNELRKHFRIESEELFIVARTCNLELGRIVIELEQQQKAIYKHINDLSGGGDLEIQLDIAGMAMQAHVRKQERQFFPLVQDVMPDRLANLASRIKLRCEALQRSCTGSVDLKKGDTRIQLNGI